MAFFIFIEEVNIILVIQGYKLIDLRIAPFYHLSNLTLKPIPDGFCVWLVGFIK